MAATKLAIIENIENENFQPGPEQVERLQELVEKTPELYRQRTGDDALHAKFIEQFPAASLAEMTPEEYCLGFKDNRRSFSWWIERGLKPAMGRYSPGSARAHLVYRREDDSFYLHSKLADLSPEEAVGYVARTTGLIADQGELADTAWLDDDAKIYSRLKLEPRVVSGQARRLRIFQVYHPESAIPINSPEHIEHFLKLFGVRSSWIPGGSFARLIALHAIYEQVRKAVGRELSPWGFAHALYSEELHWDPIRSRSANYVSDEDGAAAEEEEELNTILYGPPGTGKTHQAITRAVRICDPEFYKAHESQHSALKNRFDELNQSGRVSLISFHPGYTYEDFVEGIRPSSEEGKLSYVEQDGLFKNLCDNARNASASETRNQSAYKLSADQRIWKMSLGNTLNGEEYVFEECLKKDRLLLGYGGSVDFSDAPDRSAIRKKIESADLNTNSFAATAVDQFVNNMRKGDLVIVSEGNLKFRAIGEITGDYRLVEAPDGRDDYLQSRDVRWIRIFQPGRPAEQLFDKAISQLPIYPFSEAALRREKLQILLDNTVRVSGADALPHVLIIDEINRGNISKIFGELITLLEKDRRDGEPGAVRTTLPLSRESFSVPKNLYIIGTMNTADRSLAHLDIALRRRFAFREQVPDLSLLRRINIEGVEVGRLLETINDRIEILYDRDHQIGHTYFLPLIDDASLSRLGRLFETSIFPLLDEYFFEDRGLIRRILGDEGKSADEHQFLRPRFSPDDLARLVGADTGDSIPYYWNKEALDIPEAYIAVYES